MKKNFSGGGILPIVDVSTESGIVPCFITFSSRRGVLSDAGGKVDPSEFIQKTCSREFWEESCMSFSIPVEHLDEHSFFDITFGSTFYRVYLPKFNLSVDTELFNQNYKQLKSERMPSVFLENVGMVLLPINVNTSSFLFREKKYYIYKDLSGEDRIVSKRLHKIIKLFIHSSPKLKKINFRKTLHNKIQTFISE
jgi:hypothetical protein